MRVNGRDINVPTDINDKFKNLDTKNKMYVFMGICAFLTLLCTYISPSFFYVLQSSISKYTFYQLIFTSLLSVFSIGFVKKQNIKIPWVLLIPLCALISSLFILTTNKVFSGEPKANTVNVVSKSYSSSSKSRRKDYYVKVTSWKNPNNLEIIHVSYDAWNVAEINSQHVVKVRKGIFGLEFNAIFY